MSSKSKLVIRKLSILVVFSLIAVFLGSYLLIGASSALAEEIVVYSSRREQFVKPILDQFEDDTGIEVQLLTGQEAQFNLRLKEEAVNPRADVFLANDAGVMEDLRSAGVLTGAPDIVLEKIPAEFRDEDGSWFGLSARSRVIMYNKDLLSDKDLPESIFDLTDEQYRGEFAITRPGNGSMISHMAGVRREIGDDEFVSFIEDLLANEPTITGGHTDIRRAVGRGEVKLGLVNNYYYHLQLEEDQHNNVGAVYPDQGENGIGVFVNVAGAALINGGPNPESREVFINYILDEEIMSWFASISRETPLLGDVEALEYAVTIDQYKQMDISLSEIGPLWGDTLDLMESAGYTE